MGNVPAKPSINAEARRPPRRRLLLLLILLLVTTAAAIAAVLLNPGARLWLLERQSREQLAAAASRPDADPLALYVLARKLEAAGEYADASSRLRSALGRVPDSGGAGLKTKLQGELALSLAQLRLPEADSDAMRELRTALDADAGNTPAHLALGTILMRREQYEPASKEFQIVTMLEPKLAEGWFQLGRARNVMRLPELAEPALQQAVKLAPRESRYWVELGDSFGYRGKFTESRSSFEKAISVAPADEKAQMALARVQVLQARTPDDYQKAKASLQRFAEVGEGDPFFLGQLGVMDVQFGELADAERHLKRALQLMPNHPEAAYNLMMVYRRQGREAEAKQVMQKFRKLETLYRETTSLRKRITSEPENVQMHLRLARLLEAQEKYGDAFEQLGYITRHFPSYEPAQKELSRLLREHSAQIPGGTAQSQ